MLGLQSEVSCWEKPKTLPEKELKNNYRERRKGGWKHGSPGRVPLSKHKALSLNPSTARERKKEKEMKNLGPS